MPFSEKCDVNPDKLTSLKEWLSTFKSMQISAGLVKTVSDLVGLEDTDTTGLAHSMHSINVC